jgi:transcriptional regulator with XRE-family HTH domain
MSEDEIKKVFAKNLNNYLYLNGKTQADLYRYMGVSSATVSNWCNGLKMPRMDKIQAICNWLGIEKSDLLEHKSNIQEGRLSTDVTPNEFQHLNKFRSLNPAGQNKAVEYVNDLADNPKYQKDNVTITVLPTQKEGQKDTNRIELKIEGDAPYIPKVAAAHHPTGKLSEADKEDIKFLNELVGKLKKEKGE